MALTPEQVKIVNLESIVEALNRKLKDTESDLKSLQTAHSIKGRRVVELEAEIVRLRLLRTDEQLRNEVDGLRGQVGTKDREIARLQKENPKLVESEKAALRLAQQAEQRFQNLGSTLETMQHARDEAQATRDRLAGDLQKAAEENKNLTEQAKTFTKEIEDLVKLKEAALKAVRVLPPIARKSKEVRVLAALLKEPEQVEKKEEVANK